MTDTSELVERLRSKRYVREQWHEPIGTQEVSCGKDDEGAEAILRNPDGLEAATTIETLRRELDEAREAIERATLAERQRCAGKAEAEMVECENIALSCDAGSREREVYDTAASVCRIIAKAIRALQETSDDK